MASNIRITFSTDGADLVQREAAKVFSALESTSKSLIALSKNLGVNAQDAEAFAKKLGLGTVAAAQVVKAFKDMESVGASLEQNFGYLNQELDVTAEQFTTLVKGLNVATNETKAFAEEQSNLNTFADAFSKTVTNLNVPLTQFGTDLQESTNAALKLKETISKVGDISSLSEVAAAAGKSSLALETLSQKLNTSNQETKKIIESAIQFSDKLKLVADSSGKSSEEILNLVDEFKNGNLTIAKFADTLKISQEEAVKLASELENNSSLLSRFAKISGIAKDELLGIVDSIRSSDKGFGELLDTLDKTDISLSDFINSFDSAELSIKAIAIATQSTEAEIKGFIDDIQQGDRSIAEFANAMNLTEKEVLALVSSYVQLQYGSEQLTNSTTSLASSYNVVEKAVEPADKAIKAIADTTDKSADSFDDLSKSTSEAANQVEDNFGLITEKAEQMLEVLLEFGAIGVQAFAEFDSALRQSAVVGGLTEQDVRNLTAAVIQLGVETSASPTEVAKMTASLSRAGFTANEQIASLEGMIRAAEATGEEFSVLADVVGNTIRTFGLSASESNNVADVLVSAANATNTSIKDLGEAFAYVGTQAVQSNQPVADIAVVLGLLADTGLEGSAGGTALAEALSRLSQASAGANSELVDLLRGNEKMVGAFRELGASVRDSNGEMLPLVEILPIIKKRFDEIGKQEDREILAKALFGTEGSRGFLGVMEQVDTRLQVVNNTVKNSGGVAQEAGEQILDGISGTLDIFGSTVDTFNIKLGEFLSFGVEPLVQSATTLINSFLTLPPAIQQVVLGVGTLGAALTSAVVVMTIYNQLQVQSTIAALADSAAKVKLAISNFSVTASIAGLNTALGNSVKALYTTTAAATAAAGATATVGGAAATAGLSLAGLMAVLKGGVGLLGGIATALGQFAALLAPVIAAVGAVQLASASFKASVQESDKARESIDDLNESFNAYSKSVGLAYQKTIESASLWEQVTTSISEFGKELSLAAYNFSLLDFIPQDLKDLFPILNNISSAAESGARGLAIASGDINNVLNGISTAFTNFSIAGKLSSDAAQALTEQVVAAKAALSGMQESAVGNAEVGEDQLFIWQQQQSELTGILDALTAAKVETDSLSDAVDRSGDIAAQMAEKMKQLGIELDNAFRDIDDRLLQGIIDANVKYIDDANQREVAIANLESQSLDERILKVQEYIEKRKALNGLSAADEIENQEEIANLESEYLQLRVEQTNAAAELREEAGREFAERQKKIAEELAEKEEALALQVYDRKKLLLDKETADREAAVNAQIASQEAILESIDDETAAINSQLSVLELVEQQNALISQGRIEFHDREIANLNEAKSLIDLLTDAESSRAEKVIALNRLAEFGIVNIREASRLTRELSNDENQREGQALTLNELKRLGLDVTATERDQTLTQIELSERILEQERLKRAEAEARLLQQQAFERSQLAFQQELERLELDRAVRQANINALDALQTVNKAEQVVKSYQLEESEQRRLLNLAKINGASEAELINLQSQLDIANAQIALGIESIAIAQQAAILSQAEIGDAERLREYFEKIAEQQTINLGIAQKNALEQLRNTNEAAATTAQFNIAEESASRLAGAIDGATSSASGLTSEVASAAREAGLLEQNLLAAGRQLTSLEKQILDKKPGTSTGLSQRSISGVGTQYFNNGKEISEQDYNAARKAQEDSKKTTRTIVTGASVPRDFFGDNPSSKQLQDFIAGSENAVGIVDRVRRSNGKVETGAYTYQQAAANELAKELLPAILEQEAESLRNQERRILGIELETAKIQEQYAEKERLDTLLNEKIVSRDRLTKLQLDDNAKDLEAARLALHEATLQRVNSNDAAAVQNREEAIVASENRIAALRLAKVKIVSDALVALGYDINSPISSQGYKTIASRAGGGTLRRGQTALVGEDGAEIAYDRSGNAAILGLDGAQLFTPAADAEVIPASETKRILSREGAKLRSLAGGTLLGGASFTADGRLIQRTSDRSSGQLGARSYDASGQEILRTPVEQTGRSLLAPVSISNIPQSATLVTDNTELRRKYEESQRIRAKAAEDERKLQETIAANREAAANAEREYLLRSRKNNAINEKSKNDRLLAENERQRLLKVQLANQYAARQQAESEIIVNRQKAEANRINAEATQKAIEIEEEANRIRNIQSQARSQTLQYNQDIQRQQASEVQLRFNAEAQKRDIDFRDSSGDFSKQQALLQQQRDLDDIAARSKDVDLSQSESFANINRRLAAQAITENRYNEERLQTQVGFIDKQIAIKREEASIYSRGSREQREVMVDVEQLETDRINLIREYRVNQLAEVLEDSDRVQSESLSDLDNQLANQLVSEDEYNSQRLEIQTKSLDEQIKIKKQESELFQEGSDEQRDLLVEIEQLETDRINLIREYRVNQLAEVLEDSDRESRASIVSIERQQRESLINEEQYRDRLLEIQIRSLDDQVRVKEEEFELYEEGSDQAKELLIELEELESQRLDIYRDYRVTQLAEVLEDSNDLLDAQNARLDLLRELDLISEDEYNKQRKANQIKNIRDQIAYQEQSLTLFDKASDEYLQITTEIDRLRLSLFEAADGDASIINELRGIVGGGGLNIPGRASGGAVSANQPYIVGERGRELFIPNQSGTIVPNNRFPLVAPTLPGSYSPTLSGGGGFDAKGLISEIQGLRRDIANRPVPSIASNATFINEPNPLQAQINILQGQMRAARAL